MLFVIVVGIQSAHCVRRPKAEWRFLERKLRLFEPLRGTVVEVGMGAAPNLKLYAQHVDQIIGVDCNVAMHGYARRAAEAAHAGHKLRLLTGRAEALPLEDASADAVVMTHVILDSCDVEGGSEGGPWGGGASLTRC